MRRTRAAFAGAALFAAATTIAAERPISSIGKSVSADTGADGRLQFIVGGDNRPTGKGAPLPRVLKTIFGEIGLIRPDFVLWTGDTVYGKGDTPAELESEYREFESLVRTSGVPLFNAPGNHEIHRTDDAACASPSPAPSDSEVRFARRFGSLYGSFDAGGAHFIALDTEVYCREDSVDGAQLEWLESDLEAHKNAAAIFVFSHAEFFSSPHIDPASATDHPPVRNRDELHALFRKYPVRAVFSGHEHLYWREAHDGIDYFIAGGGGAPLYASPDRGGFGHYLIVTVEAGKVRYDLVEPGRLYVESPDPARRERRVWVVNSNDADIALRGISVDVPGGQCSRLTAVTDLHRWDGKPVPVPLSSVGCSQSKSGATARIEMTSPAGTSVPILLRSK